MKLSISNIGWDEKNDTSVYEMMKNAGFQGLEIAPTRIFPENPYDKNDEAKKWSESLRKVYGFSIPSMQSIWYGRSEKVFGTEEERATLINYTKKAIDFAASIGCKNLVFGCPRNRNFENEDYKKVEIEFFKELGDYAYAKGTCIGMEANPPMYNTNYINDTKAALDLIKRVNSKGFLLNLDIGTMIANKEEADELIGKVSLINHVHISEPGLKPIEKRDLHVKIKEILEKESYNNFISIEMGKQESVELIKEKLEYVKNLFN